MVSQVPLPNGNTNGIGVVVRNDAGEKLWAAMGLIPCLTEEQAIMDGIQATCIEAQKHK